MGGNEVFGTPNEDKLLAKDVKRALVLIYRTTRSLELPYLYAVTSFHCTLPHLTGTRVSGYPQCGTECTGGDECTEVSKPHLAQCIKHPR